MPYDLEVCTDRARLLTAHGREHLTRGRNADASITMLQRKGIIRQKIQPRIYREGRVIGAIEGWQLAPPPVLRQERLVYCLPRFSLTLSCPTPSRPPS